MSVRPLKEFHIWDFPDTIYIRLDDNVREQFFKEMYTKFGNQARYCSWIGLHRKTVLAHKKGYTFTRGERLPQSIPVRVLKKLKPVMSLELIKQVEDGIKGYQVKAGKPIKNPKLPIRESPEIYRIIGHMLGDGSATKYKQPYYSNSRYELRDKFRETLKIFGEVETRNDQLGVPAVAFQKPVTDVISEIFNISFHKQDKLPEFVFSASEECKCALLRALFDDEGYVSSTLGIGMTDLQLIKDMKNLLIELGINTGRLLESKTKGRKRMYNLQILMNSAETFQNLVGFSHIIKSKRLEAIIRRRHRKQRYRTEEHIRSLITTYLQSNNEARTIDIADEIILSFSHTLGHLKRMIKDREIKNRKEEKVNIWYL